MQQAVAQQAAGQDTEVETLEEVVVVGSRVQGRSAHDSPVPVDVLEGKDRSEITALRDMDSLLSATVPSYNVAQHPISPTPQRWCARRTCAPCPRTAP